MTDSQPGGHTAAESSERAATDETNERSATFESSDGRRSETTGGHHRSDDSAGSSEPPAEDGLEERAADGRSDDRTARRIRMLYWAALGVCALLALVALSRFYASVEAAIDVWIAAEYRPIASGAFNFTVLLVALVGVSAAIRRLSS